MPDRPSLFDPSRSSLAAATRHLPSMRRSSRAVVQLPSLLTAPPPRPPASPPAPASTRLTTRSGSAAAPPTATSASRSGQLSRASRSTRRSSRRVEPSVSRGRGRPSLHSPSLSSAHLSVGPQRTSARASTTCGTSSASPLAPTGRCPATPGLRGGRPLLPRPPGSDGRLLTPLPLPHSHYGFALPTWYLPYALSGQDTDIAHGSLTFAPLFPVPYAVPVLLPGTTGTLTASAGPATKYTLTLAFGQLSLPAGGLVVSGKAYPAAFAIGPGESVSWQA